METFEISDGKRTYRIHGEKVAHVSSELPSKDRWTEFSLYLSDKGEWFLQGVGRSRLQGEVDKPWVIITDDPQDWLNAVLGNDVSRLARKLLAESYQYLQTCEPEGEE